MTRNDSGQKIWVRWEGQQCEPLFHPAAWCSQRLNLIWRGASKLPNRDLCSVDRLKKRVWALWNERSTARNKVSVRSLWSRHYEQFIEGQKGPWRPKRAMLLLLYRLAATPRCRPSPHNNPSFHHSFNYGFRRFRWWTPENLVSIEENPSSSQW